jgi:hypothetical protein
MTFCVSHQKHLHDDNGNNKNTNYNDSMGDNANVANIITHNITNTQNTSVIKDIDNRSPTNLGESKMVA